MNEAPGIKKYQAIATSLDLPRLAFIDDSFRPAVAGAASVNKFTEGDVNTPFGGYKRSGSLACDNGAEALDQYLQTKMIRINVTPP